MTRLEITNGAFKQFLVFLTWNILEKAVFITFWVAHLPDDLAVLTHNSFDSVEGAIWIILTIEGITSKNGQIIGKMGHSERYEDGLFQNIPGQKDQKLFESAVRYFQAGQDNTGL